MSVGDGVSGLSIEAQEALRMAGWFPGRRVDVYEWRTRFEQTGLAMHAAAEGFLSEFGGLAVDIAGPGVNKARESFYLDPMSSASRQR